MSRRPDKTQSLLLFAGTVAFAVALLSIVDMFLPRPYDGVVLEADAPGQLIVREVAPGRVEVSMVDPVDLIAADGMTNDPVLAELAAEARDSLVKAAASLGE